MIYKEQFEEIELKIPNEYSNEVSDYIEETWEELEFDIDESNNKYDIYIFDNSEDCELVYKAIKKRFQINIESDDVWEVFNLKEGKLIEFTSPATAPGKVAPNDTSSGTAAPAKTTPSKPTTPLTSATGDILKGLNAYFKNASNMKTTGETIFTTLANASLNAEESNTKWNTAEMFKAMFAKWKSSNIRMEKKL